MEWIQDPVFVLECGCGNGRVVFDDISDEPPRRRWRGLCINCGAIGVEATTERGAYSRWLEEGGQDVDGVWS
jgi:hypothetical protein